MDNSDIKDHFSRIRASWLFFVKVNFGILAGFVTVASIWKFDGEKIIYIASNYNQFIFYLGCLVVYGLVGECFLSALWGENDSEKVLRIKIIISKVMLFALMVLTAGILIYILGFINGYLDSYASH